MTDNNLPKTTKSKYSRTIRIHQFFRSSIGFKIGIIIISLVVISLVEFALILVFFLGDIINNDFFMAYAKQRMMLLNSNEVLHELTVPAIIRSILFRFGFLSLVFGIIIAFCFRTSPQSTSQSRKRFLIFSSISLIVLGLLFLILPFDHGRM
ncbi:MAG: hypothetical protein ACFFAE_21545 [Candidatus Hodarchaeota archaeon]